VFCVKLCRPLFSRCLFCFCWPLYFQLLIFPLVYSSYDSNDISVLLMLETTVPGRKKEKKKNTDSQKKNKKTDNTIFYRVHLTIYESPLITKFITLIATPVIVGIILSNMPCFFSVFDLRILISPLAFSNYFSNNISVLLMFETTVPEKKLRSTKEKKA